MKKITAKVIFFYSLCSLQAFPWIDAAFNVIENGTAREIIHKFETDYSLKNFTKGTEKENILMAALKKDRPYEIIKIILDKSKISPDSKNKNGITAFMYACQYESNIDVIENLLTLKAESDKKKEKRILTKDRNEFTSFDYARKNEIISAEVLTLLSKYAKEPEKEEVILWTTTDTYNPIENQEITEYQETTDAHETVPELPEENTEQVFPEIVETIHNHEKQSNEFIDLSNINSPDIQTESIYLYDYEIKTQTSPIEIPENLIAKETSEQKFIKDTEKKDSDGKTKLMKAVKSGSNKTIIESSTNKTEFEYAQKNQNLPHSEIN